MVFGSRIVLTASPLGIGLAAYVKFVDSTILLELELFTSNILWKIR